MTIKEVIKRNQEKPVIEFRERNFFVTMQSMYWVGFSMLLSFYFLDLFLEFKDSQKLLLTRSVTAVVELFFYSILMVNRNNRKRMKVVSFFIIGIMAIYSAFLTFYSGGWDSIYWVGFLFVLIFVLSLWPVSILESVIFTLLLISIYNCILILLIGKFQLVGFIKSNIFIVGIEIMGITVSYLYNRQTLYLYDAMNDLSITRKRADNLLLNILPEEIAERLKRGETTISKYFDKVAILFADIVGFTEFCSEKTSYEVVAILNQIFYAFDKKTEELSLEKIKTIGDGYMIMSGDLLKHTDNLQKAIDLGTYMIRFIKSFNNNNGLKFSVRVGVHIGSLTAGVIGKTKFAFDIWGDTVNIAVRMGSTGVPNEIHITEEVADYLRDKTCCECRGRIDVKGKGKMNTYIIKTV